MNTFNLTQLNNLQVGNRLAAEISPTLPVLKAFILVHAYIPSEQGKYQKLSRIINSEPQKAHYRLYKYEVTQENYESKFETPEHCALYAFKQDAITSMDILESLIKIYIQDFSAFKVIWNFYPPLPFY